MEFKFTAEDLAFRQEVETFLKTELGPEYEGSIGEDDRFDLAWQFTDKLAKKRWLAPAWPTEYGGLGLSHWQQLIYNELLSYHRAPLGQSWCGVQLVGPTLMVYASEEQKQQYLPAILENRMWWGQGFSEPNSGSDLASLQTRAVVDGDDFVVNGGKIWTTGGHHAQNAIVLVRTDPEAPKHKGISFLLMDLKAAGVTVQPLVDLANRRPFSQVFFEDVRVPKANLVGELNRGWYQAATTLDFERSGVGRSAAATRTLEEVVQLFSTTSINGRRPIEDPIVRHKLAQVRIEIDAARWISYSVVALQSQGKIPNYEASVAKLFGSEMNQRFSQLLVNLMGSYGLLREGSHAAKMLGRGAEYYMGTIPETIYEGSSEIQRNVISTRGLGLPRM